VASVKGGMEVSIEATERVSSAGQTRILDSNTRPALSLRATARPRLERGMRPGRQAISASEALPQSRRRCSRQVLVRRMS
jgi:hypothetical protein